MRTRCSIFFRLTRLESRESEIRRQNRSTLARISSAVLVQRNGRGCSLVTAMYSVIAASSARVLRWTPRRICFSVSVANQRSTRLIHEAPVGVKCR
jgi:hypothetical protein